MGIEERNVNCGNCIVTQWFFRKHFPEIVNIHITTRIISQFIEAIR